MPKRTEKCLTCARPTNNAYICRRCANELRDLLIGSPEVDGQPGIIWYTKRLRESAYGQTRMARSLSARTSNTGYALLGNKRAAELLARAGTVLARWEAVVMRLCDTHSHETGLAHTGSPYRDSERLEARRARFIATHVVLVRHHCPEAHRLHAELLDIARQAWRIINRPNDICCGPCPTMIPNYVQGVDRQGLFQEGEIPCGTMLYAEEGAISVQCTYCHRAYDVDQLREGMKLAVRDMLFTRAELIKLMETRLNDPIKQTTFGKYLRTNKLQPREMRKELTDDGWIETPMYTYNDVCAARMQDNRIRAS